MFSAWLRQLAEFITRQIERKHNTSNVPTLGWHFCMQYLVVCNVTHRYNYDIRKALSSDVHEESREILDLWKQSESNLW